MGLAHKDQLQNIAGRFWHKETEACFEFANGAPADIPAEGATHTVYVGDVTGFNYRAAIVKKTVAYVAVDEDENGIVWEKWPIKGYTLFKKA